jgi:hypothetical protein
MAGLAPAIHVLLTKSKKTWMPGIKPGMTTERSGQLSKSVIFYIVATHIDQHGSLNAGNTRAAGAFFSPTPLRATQTQTRRLDHVALTTMWLSLFSIVTGIALGLGVGAVVLESQEENVRS